MLEARDGIDLNFKNILEIQPILQVGSFGDEKHILPL
jgi:hypothetical protein